MKGGGRRSRPALGEVPARPARRGHSGCGCAQKRSPGRRHPTKAAATSARQSRVSSWSSFYLWAAPPLLSPAARAGAATPHDAAPPSLPLLSALRLVRLREGRASSGLRCLRRPPVAECLRRRRRCLLACRLAVGHASPPPFLAFFEGWPGLVVPDEAQRRPAGCRSDGLRGPQNCGTP